MKKIKIFLFAILLSSLYNKAYSDIDLGMAPEGQPFKPYVTFGFDLEMFSENAWDLKILEDPAYEGAFTLNGVIDLIGHVHEIVDLRLKVEAGINLEFGAENDNKGILIADKVFLTQETPFSVKSKYTSFLIKELGMNIKYDSVLSQTYDYLGSTKIGYSVEKYELFTEEFGVKHPIIGFVLNNVFESSVEESDYYANVSLKTGLGFNAQFVNELAFMSFLGLTWKTGNVEQVTTEDGKTKKITPSRGVFSMKSSDLSHAGAIVTSIYGKRKVKLAQLKHKDALEKVIKSGKTNDVLLSFAPGQETPEAPKPPDLTNQINSSIEGIGISGGSIKDSSYDVSWYGDTFFYEEIYLGRAASLTLMFKLEYSLNDNLQLAPSGGLTEGVVVIDQVYGITFTQLLKMDTTLGEAHTKSLAINDVSPAQYTSLIFNFANYIYPTKSEDLYFKLLVGVELNFDLNDINIKAKPYLNLDFIFSI